MADDDMPLDPIAINLGKVKPGDVVLVHGEPGADFLNAMAEQLIRKCGHRDFVLIAMQPGMGMDILDQPTMRQHGWQRIPGFTHGAQPD